MTAESVETEIEGRTGRIFVRTWLNPDARFLALISHGYGEHIGRYEHVAERLVAEGAVVVGARPPGPRSLSRGASPDRGRRGPDSGPARGR